MKVLQIIIVLLISAFSISQIKSIDCSGETPYIDKSTGTDICVASCHGDYKYIDAIDKPAVCVSSCVDSTEDSYIYPGNNSCLLNCGDDYPYRDKTSFYKICTDLCSPYYIYDSPDSDSPICVEICKLQNENYIGYEYLIDEVTEKKCVTQCEEDKPVIDNRVSSNPRCVAKCPAATPYANPITTNEIQLYICVLECDGKADQADSEAITYCVEKCPDERKYLDTTTVKKGLCKSSCNSESSQIFAYQDSDDEYYCVESCPANDAEFIDDITTDQATCAPKCPDQHSKVLSEKGLLYCVESCTDYTLQKQYNGTLTIIQCVGGDDPDIEGCNFVNDDDDCQATCDQLILAKDGEKSVCLDKCPEDYPYVDRPDESNKYCIAKCKVEGRERIYIDKLTLEGTQYCVDSCKTLTYYVDSLTSENPECVKSCDDFIDMTLEEPVCVSVCTEKYENQIEVPHICTDNCEDNFYNEISEQNKCAFNCGEDWEDATTSITADKKMCVSSCDSSLYEDTRNEKKCVTECGDYFQNDVVLPKECSESCSEHYQYETDSLKKCTDDCNFEESELPYKETQENGDKKCVKTCNELTTPYLDTTTDPSNPECKSSCPKDMEYLDTISNKGISECASSCPESDPSSFQHRESGSDFISCVRPCPEDYPYADPVSNYSIGTVCTKRCPYSDFVVDNTTDKGMAVCSKVCPEAAPYIDYYVREDRALLCTEKCSTNLFIDDLTYSGIPICVKSCKNLIPYAFINPTTPEFESCTRSCPEDKPYVDWTDPDFPICSQKCPDDQYIDSLTTPGTLFCVKSCKNLIPSAYINYDAKTCVRECKDDDFSLYIDETDSEEPSCTKACPGTAPYINSLTNSKAPVCVSSCKNLIPSAFINKEENQCVESCTYGENTFYIDDTNADPKCTDSCPEAALYLDDLTNPSSPICVSSCKNLIFSAFINKEGNKCVESCIYDENTFYIDDTNADPKCTDSCPEAAPYLDDITNSASPICVSSCKNLIPSAFIYDGACVQDCGDIYINAQDANNPACTNECPPEMPFIDSLTNAEAQICVSSCKNLIPSAFINKDQNSCVRKCKTDEETLFIDQTDPTNPMCTDECPNLAPYLDELTNSDMPICVSSCKNLEPLSYIDHDNKKCVRTCNDSPYILANLEDPDHYKCVEICPDTAPYIDTVTNESISICVPSCKNLQPKAFIETGTNQCLRECTEAQPYIDNMTALHPKCVANCKDQALNKYIDDTTYYGSKVCVPVCQYIEPIAFIDPRNEDFEICVQECPNELPYIDATTKQGDLTCVEECPAAAPYIDSITNDSISVCVPSCKNLQPQAFIENGTNQCIRKCTEDLPYIDNITSLYSKCISSCSETENSKYIDSFTYFGSQVCTKSCKYLTPISYIDPRIEEHEICVHSCPEQLPYVDNITVQNDLLCVAKCPSTYPYLDSITTENVIYCVDSCWKIPAKAYLDAITDDNLPTCVIACQSTSPNLDRITDRGNPNCVISCPQDTAMFLDNVSLPKVPVCLDECEETAPYDDQVTIPSIPRCLKECLPGTYLYKTHCLACESPCEECFGTATNCTKCDQDFFLYNNSCPAICPDGYYGETDTWTCDQCYESCATCIEKSSTDCTSCNDNYIFTSKNECLSENNFAEQTENLEIEDISSLSELEFKTEQIKNIGNLNNTGQTQAEVQTYMKESMDKSIEYLDSYIQKVDKLQSPDESQIMVSNLQKMTNITVELEMDEISTLISDIIDKVDETKINKTIVSEIFETQNNLLKYKKNDYKNYNESASSISTAEDFLFEQIEKLSDKGLYVMMNAEGSSRRLLSDDQIQLFLEYQEFSLILESHNVDDNYWIQSVGTTSTEATNSYQSNEQFNYTDLAKVSVTYSKSFFTLLKNKINDLGKSVNEIAFTKVIAYNYLREASNKYERALLNSQTAVGSVVTFQFKCQDKSNTTLFYNLDMTNLNDYIEVRVPINYKLTGEETLKCMTYNSDHEEWTMDNIITGEKTENYVLCKTKQTNAITVLSTDGIDFSKNYEIYLACLQLPLAAIIMLVAYFLKSKHQSIVQKYLSLSPWLSSLTCQNFYQFSAKLMLFSSQLGLIEFVIAGLFKYQNGTSEGEAKHVALAVFLSLLIGYAGKYIFGAFLTVICLYAIPCVLYTLLMIACYLILAFWACYFVSHPNHDDAYNVGLKSSLIAISVDFIIFDFFIISVVKIMKLEKNQLKFFQLGGYLTLRTCKYSEYTKNSSINSENDQDQEKKIIQTHKNEKQKQEVNQEQLKFDDDELPEDQQQKIQLDNNEDCDLTIGDEKAVKRLDVQSNQI